jgi:hypothetical protein
VEASAPADELIELMLLGPAIPEATPPSSPAPSEAFIEEVSREMKEMESLDEDIRMKHAEEKAAHQSPAIAKSVKARAPMKPLEGDDKKLMDQIAHALDNNQCSSRCPLAQRMNKQKVKPTKEQLASYNASSHNDALRLFRLEWAKAEKDRLV